MLKPQIVGAMVLALGVAACASDDRYAYSEPHYVASSAPVYTNAPPAVYAANDAYATEGRVVAIDVVGGEHRSSGAGAVLGGIAGGVIGHQFGSGRGNTAATAAGAVGGAVAGNEIEKRRSDDQRYRITVQFRDGREATFEQEHLGDLRVGDRVRIDRDRVVRD